MQKSYFPDLGRFPRVENSRVADLYFGKGQTTDLLLLMARKGAVGRLTVTPRRYSARLTEAALGSAVGEIFFTGRFDPARFRDATVLGEVVWNGSLFLNQGLESEGLRLQVRLPKLNLMGQIVLEGKPCQLSYQVRRGSEVIADSKDADRNRALLSQLLLIGKMAGIQIPGGDALRDWQGMLKILAPQIVCRHGQFAVFGRRYDGYVVNLRWTEDVQVDLLITELGELLRLEGIPGLDILAESFVPEELMEPEEGEKNL